MVVADAGRDRGRQTPTRSSACRTGASASASPTRPAARACRRPSTRAVKEAERDAEEAERRRLYYVAMTRAIDRLIVSGAIGEGGADANTPIGWVLDRLDARELGDAGEDRWRSSAAARGCCCASTASRRSRAAPRRRPPRRSSSSSCSRSRRTATRASGARARARAARRGARAAAPPRAPALVLGARRCSSAARTATSRSGSSACARPSGPACGDGGLAATEVGDAVHCCWRTSTCAPRRAAGPRRAGARPLPGRDRRGARADPRLRRRYCDSRAGRAGSRRSRARRPSARSRSSTTASSCTAASTSSTATASARSSSTTRRTRSAEGTPAEIVEHDYRLQRLVYALACFRAGAEEVEVVYQFLERPDELVDTSVHGRRGPGARGGAVGGDRADPGGRVPADAGRVRLRRLPRARPRLRRACELRDGRAGAMASRATSRRRGGASARSASGSCRSSSGCWPSTPTRGSRSSSAATSSCSSR